jgi:hypothetical protein
MDEICSTGVATGAAAEISFSLKLILTDAFSTAVVKAMAFALSQ